MGLGEVDSVAEIRSVVRLSFETGVRKVDKIQIRLDPKLRSL